MWGEGARSRRWVWTWLLASGSLSACGGRDALSLEPYDNASAVSGRGGSAVAVGGTGAVAGRGGGSEAGGSAGRGSGIGGAGAVGGSGGTIGSAGTGGVSRVGEPCSAEGAKSCDGVDQQLLTSCVDGFWRENGQCPGSLLCVPAFGDCQHPFEECQTRPEGTQFCDGNVLMRCGATLVDASVVGPCAGECVESIAHAYCSTARCGDGVVQTGEECDDANAFDTDTCLSCRVARCGDGVVRAGYETCDAGPMGDEKCSMLCGWRARVLEVGSNSNCALGANGRIQCWGENVVGQLGVGSLNFLGDAAGEMGRTCRSSRSGPSF